MKMKLVISRVQWEKMGQKFGWLDSLNYPLYSICCGVIEGKEKGICSECKKPAKFLTKEEIVMRTPRYK